MFAALLASLPLLQGCPGGFNFSGPGTSIRGRTGHNGFDLSARTPDGSFDIQAGKGGARIRVDAPGARFQTTAGRNGAQIHMSRYPDPRRYSRPPPNYTPIPKGVPPSSYRPPVAQIPHIPPRVPPMASLPPIPPKPLTAGDAPGSTLAADGTHEDQGTVSDALLDATNPFDDEPVLAPEDLDPMLGFAGIEETFDIGP